MPTVLEPFHSRGFTFACQIVRLYLQITKSPGVPPYIARQLLQAGTSVGANYRAVCRARSKREFCSKLGVVVEEADETAFWFELLIEAEIVPPRRLSPLLTEGNELLAIIAASLRTARKGPKRVAPQ